MESMILTAMNGPVSINANSAIPLGNAVHKYGNDIVLNGNSIQFKSKGYYSMIFNVTATSATATTITITLYCNGTPIALATSEQSIGANGVANITIPWAIKKNCCADDKIITAVCEDAVTITNVIAKVEKS